MRTVLEGLEAEVAYEIRYANQSEPEKEITLPLAQAQQLIKSAGLVRRLEQFKFLRTPDGLTLIHNGQIFYIDLKPDDNIVGYEHHIDKVGERVNVRIYVATAWEQFTQTLDWKRQGVRRFNLRLADFGLLLRQDGEWYNMEGLLANVMQPETTSEEDDG